VQAWLHDRMVWLLRVEQHRRVPWGLSLLAVARKEQPQGSEGGLSATQGSPASVLPR